MQYFIYILHSKTIDDYFVGITNDLTDSFQNHNLGYNKLTKKGIPWELKFSKKFDKRNKAIDFKTSIHSDYKKNIEKLLKEVKSQKNKKKGHPDIENEIPIAESQGITEM